MKVSEHIDSNLGQVDMLAQIVVGVSGRVLFVSPGCTESWGGGLEVWQGKSVDTYLPHVDAHQTLLDRLVDLKLGNSEFVWPLSNGPVLKIRANRLYLTPQSLQRLWRDHNMPWSIPLEEIEEEVFWLTVVNLRQIHNMYQSDAETRLRATIGSIIAGFAHEVRNPLAATLSLVEGIMALEEDSETMQPLSRIPVHVERIENLIKEALSYGKPRAPQASWHQLHFLIQRSAEMLAQAGIELPASTFPQESTVLPVYVDAEQIISVIANLMQNAAEEAGSDGVMLHVVKEPEKTGDYSLRWNGALVALDVMDRGGGVDPSLIDTLFEPFVTSKSKGTGLGLAIARDLALLNGGNLYLRKTSPEGSTFRLLLPSYVF
ncbi:MAG: hypothetical protein EP343_06365 [Deltaproteobacteria bacterium]|nr:MAG: hypothetical protein EP343_06365 [Deltaproteobacteria bacterium]